MDPTVAGQPCVLGPKTDETLPCCFGNRLDSSTCFSCSPENLRIHQLYCLLQSCSCSCYSFISYKITNNLIIQCRRHNNLWMQLARTPQEVDLTSSFASIWTHKNPESSLELWALLARPETKNDQFPHMMSIGRLSLSLSLSVVFCCGFPLSFLLAIAAATIPNNKWAVCYTTGAPAF